MVENYIVDKELMICSMTSCSHLRFKTQVIKVEKGESSGCISRKGLLFSIMFNCTHLLFQEDRRDTSRAVFHDMIIIREM